MDLCVSHATAAGLKVIFSHRGNEAPVGACASIQQNGLWFDSGGNSGGADGCGTTGTVTYATFKANTVALMQRYNNSSTVIGYEFHHAPLINGTFTGQANGSGGGTTGPFTISGGQIRSSDGNLWHAFGINILCNDGPNVPVATFKAVYPKANFVRFACWDGYTAAPSNAAIEAFVNSYTAQGIVVAIESHYSGQQAANSVGLAGEASWYSALATDLKNNHLAWFMSGNELSQPGLTAEHVNVVNAVRGAGKTDPILLTSVDGNPFDHGGTPDGPTSVYNAMSNVIWDFHYYNWVAGGSTDQPTQNNTLIASINAAKNYTTSANGAIPVIEGEDGYNDYVCTNNGPTGGGCGSTQAINAVQTAGITNSSGYAIWLWSFQSTIGCCAAQTDQVTEPSTLTSLGQNTFNNMATNGSGPLPATGGGVNAAINWGGGGDTDIKAACGDVGAAVNAVNSGVILFCPAPLNNATVLLMGATKP
jgi:hypothetical protein